MKVVNFRQRSAGEFVLVEEDEQVVRLVHGERGARGIEPAVRVDGSIRSAARRRRDAGIAIGAGRSVGSALRVSSERKELVSATSMKQLSPLGRSFF